MVVGDVMTPVVATVEPTTTIAETAALMGRYGVGSALIMEDRRLVGIFTERDLVRAMAAKPTFNPHAPTKHWMTADPQTIEREVDIGEALQRMVGGRFRHLPVVNEMAEPIGMISMRDLVSSYGRVDRTERAPRGELST